MFSIAVRQPVCEHNGNCCQSLMVGLLCSESGTLLASSLEQPAQSLGRRSRSLSTNDALPLPSSAAVPVPAARRAPPEGPTRGSSAALEALLGSPHAVDIPSLSLDSPAAPPPPPDALMQATLPTQGGNLASAPGEASTAAAQPPDRGAMPSLGLRPPDSAAGERTGQGSDGRVFAATGGVSEGVASVPDTPPSPFMSAQRDLAGLASVSSFEAVRSAVHPVPVFLALGQGKA